MRETPCSKLGEHNTGEQETILAARTFRHRYKTTRNLCSPNTSHVCLRNQEWKHIPLLHFSKTFLCSRTSEFRASFSCFTLFTQKREIVRGESCKTGHTAMCDTQLLFDFQQETNTVVIGLAVQAFTAALRRASKVATSVRMDNCRGYIYMVQMALALGPNHGRALNGQCEWFIVLMQKSNQTALGKYMSHLESQYSILVFILNVDAIWLKLNF